MMLVTGGKPFVRLRLETEKRFSTSWWRRPRSCSVLMFRTPASGVEPGVTRGSHGLRQVIR